jgi:hypothetical protein
MDGWTGKQKRSLGRARPASGGHRTHDGRDATRDRRKHESYGGEKQKMSANAKTGYSVTLNKETFDLLQVVRGQLIGALGFEPTNGQVVRHLISLFIERKV